MPNENEREANPEEVEDLEVDGTDSESLNAAMREAVAAVEAVEKKQAHKKGKKSSGEPHGEEHAAGAEKIAAPCRARFSDAFQPDDEEDGRDQIADIDEVTAAHASSPVFLTGRRVENIDSMRFVTRKPPTTLMVASVTAPNASRVVSVE